LDEKTSGLPDGVFSDQISLFGYIWEDLGMENVFVFSNHLEYLTTIFLAFGHFLFIWFIFTRFDSVPRKIWQP
jgi:hypothetical protein